MKVIGSYRCRAEDSFAGHIIIIFIIIWNTLLS